MGQTHRVRAARAAGAVRVAVVVAVVVLTAMVGAPAHAHTGLVASTPGDGDTIGSPVERVVLVFGAPIDPHHHEVVVQDSSGRTVSHGAAGVSGSSLEQAMQLSSPGEHSVGYRVIGSDGHAVVGSFTFTATAAAVVVAEGDAASTGGVTGAFQVASSEPGEGFSSGRSVVLVLAAAALALATMVVIGHRKRARPARGPAQDD